MLRDVAILGAAIVIFQVTGPGARGAPVTEIPPTEAKQHRPHHDGIAAIEAEARHWAEAKHWAAARRHGSPARGEDAAEPVTAVTSTYQLPPPAIDTSLGAPTSLAYHVPAVTVDPAPEQAPSGSLVLSDQEKQASQMAGENGDRTYLMVDKALGKIILFENGQPVFSGAALTGQSAADRLPTGELTQKFDNLNALDTKVTPAGRYHVERGYDQEYGGPLLDISEIKGKDWGIAIHQVWLGDPAEHRDVRIRSPNEADKHITFGCINVTKDAIRYLLKELPEGATPLYILPTDGTKTATFVADHSS